MAKTKERRREERLYHHLPVWFAEDSNGTAFQGAMVDISSRGMAFSCGADENCPYPGQHLTTRFSIPRFGTNDPSDMQSFTRSGRVCRVDKMSNSLCHVAIQFDEPPPFWDMPPTAK